MAKVIGIETVKRQDKTIYDPTCGSGSLLLKAADETDGITIYGQEMDNATRALAKMNMILHGHPTAEVWQDNTLSSPYFKDGESHLKTFDFAVANPPFSSKAWRNGFKPEEDEYNRFEGYGIPPAKNGDYAFLLHLIRSLKSTGKGAIILPHGVLFRGNIEAEIRTNILKKGYIKGIIGLPANLFYGTGIPACIIVIDKENAVNRDSIFIIDASKGFIKDGNKNRLREQDIHKIVDVFNKQLVIPKYSRLVPIEEIEGNEYNLNIPRYIDSQEAEDIQDIEAHLLGGIPNRDIDDLERYWSVYPGLRKKLFTPIKREGYSQLKITQDEIKQNIFNHPEFVSYSKKIDKIIQTWSDDHVSLLKGLSPNLSPNPSPAKREEQIKPKELIYQLSEAILTAFSETNLIDKYDVFQHLMVYWTETMKDDVYFIIEEGWKAEPYAILDKKGKPKKDEWDCDLIPKPLVINRYFADEQAQIEQLEADKEAITRDKGEMEEEHSGEDGYLEDVKNDKGKITKGNVQARIKELQQELDWGEELTIFKDYLALLDKETKANTKVKNAQKELDKKLLEQYKKLTEEEVKTLVVDDKWLATITQEIKTELDRISQRLTQRIKELAERYERTLPELTTRFEELESKVNQHLQKMGFSF